MKWVDKWIIKHTTWIKPLDDLTLEELFKLIGNFSENPGLLKEFA